MRDVLSVRQTAFFISIMLLSSKLLVLPGLLFKENRYGGLFTITIFFLIELAVFYLLIKIKERHPNQTFFEYFSSFLGRVVTRIIYFVLFVFFLLKLIYLSHESFNFLKLVLYENAGLLVYFVCLLPVCNALCYKGLKAFGRTLEVFFYIIIFGIVVCCFMWIASITNLGFNILDNNGFSGLFQSIYNYVFWFCDFAFLFIFLDRVKLQNNFGVSFLKNAGLTMVILVFLTYSYYSIYQASSFFHTSAILDIMQFSTRLGSVGKLDILPAGLIMFLLFYQFSVFLYCAKDCYKKVLNSNDDLKALIFINLLFLLLNYFVFYNLDILINSYRYIFSALGIFVLAGLPLMLFFKFVFEKKNLHKNIPKAVIKNYLKY